MDGQLIEIEDITSVMRKIGIEGSEAEKAMAWMNPTLERPLSEKDEVLAELTSEEQAFLRSIGYALHNKKGDPMRRRALIETFWTAVRIFHDLPLGKVTIKEGKYLVN